MTRSTEMKGLMDGPGRGTMVVAPCGGRFTRLTLKVTVSLLSLAGLVKGNQDDPQRHLKGLSLQQLGNIEVTTASKVPVKITRTPSAIYVITQDDIRRSGATSIPEALRLAPGIAVARSDAVKWSVGIRGFGSRLSRGVLVVIDGRNVYSPLYAGVFWEVQDTLMEDVERIEIIRGPGATIWGPNAVNGVINIITKKAGDTRGGLVSASGGNEHLIPSGLARIQERLHGRLAEAVFAGMRTVGSGGAGHFGHCLLILFVRSSSDYYR